MTSARRELILSAVFLDFCFLLLSTGLQLVEQTDLCWCHRCAIFSVLAEYMFECAPALWMLMHFRFGGSKIVCAGKFTSANAKPVSSALPHDAQLHVSATNIPILILFALLISQTLSLSLPVCCYFLSAQISVSLRQHNDFTVSGRKLAFRSNFGVHSTSSMLILQAYTRRNPLLQLYGPYESFCTDSLL